VRVGQRARLQRGRLVAGQPLEVAAQALGGRQAGLVLQLFRLVLLLFRLVLLLFCFVLQTLILDLER